MVRNAVLLLRGCRLRAWLRPAAFCGIALLPWMLGVVHAQVLPEAAAGPGGPLPTLPAAPSVREGATGVQPPVETDLAGRVAAAVRIFLRPRGHLLIVGGGDTPVGVQQRFVALAGGDNARIAVFPMASSKSDEEAVEVARDFTQLGAQAQVVDIRPGDANSAAVVQELQGFTGFWFSGGDQSRLSSLLVGTRALQTIESRYLAGAVVGGTSAGASVMSRLMLTGKWRAPRNSEEEEQVNIARGMKEVARGFGLFRGAIVDQHFMRRARYNRLISAVLDHPQLIGVGIDEETALLVRPDGLWEVLGNYYVKLFDARRAQIVDDQGPMAKAADIRMHVLPEGGLFDPQRRKVTFQELHIP